MIGKRIIGHISAAWLLLCGSGFVAIHAQVADTLAAAVPEADAAVPAPEGAREAADSVTRGLAPLQEAGETSLAPEVDTEALMRELEAAAAKARELRLNYDFQAAVDLCREALDRADTLAAPGLEEELVLSQNGLGMMQFASTPKVVTSHIFPLKTFFLFYPLPQESWRRVPNVLDPRGAGDMVEAMYVPEGATDIYYSAKDEVGVRNIYHSSLGDSTWTVPRLINEHTTSSSDEIYPMLCDGGKSLYFASKGLYGMGGYDIYVSKWNDSLQDWDVPVNLGVPYSSPYDDFLYINTDDGKYTIFASNRDCPPDSVKIYVLEYDILPVRKQLSSPEELRELAALRQSGASGTRGNLSSVTSPMQEDPETALYMEKVAKARRVRKELAAAGAALEQLRARYSSAPEDEREALRAEILAKELELPAMQDKVKAASAELQKVELEFLMKGIVIDPDSISSAADKEVVGGVDSYLFSRGEWGAPLNITVDKPVPDFDYGFKVLETGQFAADNTLPDGLVYQIQMASFLRPLGEDELKGLSPVFERISGGRFTYSAGLFSSYSDALSKLNTVKRAGWRSAVITAYQDGSPISIQTARRLESHTVTLYKVRIAPADGLNLREMALSAIHQQTGSDIARVMDGAAVMYEVGPFDDRQKCEELRSTLIATGETNVTIVEGGKIITEQ